MFNDRHKFILESPNRRMVLNRDPMGWDETETTIGRSDVSFGIFMTVSNNLRFTGKAKEFLENEYQVHGVQAEVLLTKLLKHPKTDEWQLAKGFPGYLDFTTWNIKENSLEIDFSEGGIREILASQMREKFELNRTTDINGNAISPLKPDTLSIEGRDIYLLSKWHSKEVTEFTVSSGGLSFGYDEAFKPAPLEVTANSDEENVVSPMEQLDKEQQVEGGAATKLFLLSDRDRGKTKINIKLSFKITDYKERSNGGIANPVDNERLKVVLRRYHKISEENEFEFNQNEDQWTIIDVGNPNGLEGQSFSTPEGGYPLELSPENDNEIKEGQSFGLYFLATADYNGGGMDVDISEYSASVNWEEDSFFRPTTASALRAYNVGERLTEIYTGKPTFRSSLLNTGKWKDLVMSCGFWIRNMKKQVNEDGETEERTLTINFEDFYKSVHAIEPCGYGIVTEGNKQFIALEKLRYFFQQTRTVQLGQISNIERSVSTEFIFSSISTGYTKGGNYEKPLGLDEYNIQTNFITPITKVESKYDVLGPSRTDSYGVEQPRRMQFTTHPDEDTDYDKDNYLIDSKLLFERNGKTIFEPRKWQDDFAKAPTGIYSPETAFNLRLTPMYNLFRHSYWFNAATVKYPTNKMRYASSEGNSELSTQKIGELEIKENSDVLISQLSNPIFEPEWVEFKLPASQELINQLQGTTKVGEEYINNYYGQVEFINDLGQKERGYLFSAKISKTVKIKLLKAFF